jgi:hypothetical protein
MQIRLVSVAVGTARRSILTAAGSILFGPTEVAARVVWSGTTVCSGVNPVGTNCHWRRQPIARCQRQIDPRF